MSQRQPRVIRWASCLALMVAAFLAPWTRSPAGDRPSDDTRVTEADFAAIETMAEIILIRRDAVADLEARLADADEAVERCLLAHTAARARVEASRASMKLYKEETYPVARDVARSELGDSELNRRLTNDRNVWAKDMLRKGYYSEEQAEQEAKIAEQAKIRAEAARKTLDLIEKVLYPKDCESLQTEVFAAEKDEIARAKAFERAKLAYAEAERRVTEVALTKAELKAIVRMDEAIRYSTSGQASAARVALNETQTLWRGEAAHRAAIKTAALRRRVNVAADEIRAKSATH
jgi:hypothetical protein